jgi:hypothetical protein
MAFEDEWPRFLENIHALGKRKFRRRPSTTLEGLFDDVIKALQGQDVTDEIAHALIVEKRNPDDARIVDDYLAREMKYFNEIAEANIAEGEDAHPEGPLEAGQTVKESIEELVHLPEWVKKILKILNELLSLIRGG